MPLSKDFAPENFRFFVLSLPVKARAMKSGRVLGWFGSGCPQVTPPSLCPGQQQAVPAELQEVQFPSPRSILTLWGQAGLGCPARTPLCPAWRELVTSRALRGANCLSDVSFPRNAAHNHSNYTWQSLIIAFPFNQFLLKYSFCARFQLIFSHRCVSGLGNIPVGRSIRTQDRMTRYISWGDPSFN